MNKSLKYIDNLGNIGLKLLKKSIFIFTILLESKFYIFLSCNDKHLQKRLYSIEAYIIVAYSLH